MTTPSTRNMSSMTQRKQATPTKQDPKTAGTSPIASKRDDIKVLHDKTNPSALTLSVNGKKVVISEAELTQLLQPHQKGKTQGTDTKAIAQHGLKPKDIIAYLKSPGGKINESLKQEQLSILVSLKEQRAAAAHRKELLRQLFLANIHRMKIAKRKAAIKAAIAANNKQIQKNLAADRAAMANSSSSSYIPQMSDAALRDYLLTSYDRALQDLDNEIEQSLIEAQRLEDEIAAHLLSGEEIRARYELLATYLDRLEAHSASLEGLSVEERMSMTQSVFNEANRELLRVVLQIQTHANQGEEFQAQQGLNHLDGLYLMIEGLQAMAEHESSKNQYVTEEGQITVAYHQAAFIVPKEQHIYKDKATGQFYLLAAGQKFEDMTAEEKVAAQAKFEEFKPELVNAKGKVQQFHEFEMRDFNNTHVALQARSDALQKHILNTVNQRNNIEALKANLLAQADDARIDLSNTPAPTPTIPTPRPAPTGQAEVRPQSSVTQSYRHVLQLMRINPSQEAIDRFKAGLVLSNGEPNKAAQEAVTKSIKPGMLILPATMNNLLRNLERLGVSANKPSVTSIPSVHPQSLGKPKPEEPPKRTAPDPFKITPY